MLKTVDTELIVYFAHCKTYSEYNGLNFLVTNVNKYALLAPLVPNLLLAHASEPQMHEPTAASVQVDSEAYVKRVFSVCGELTARKRHRLTKSLKGFILKMNLKYYA